MNDPPKRISLTQAPDRGKVAGILAGIEKKLAGPGGASMGPPPADAEGLEGQIIAALRTVFDPELPINIYELGLVYAIHIDPQNAVAIDMTLTAPACPVAESLPREVEAKVRAVPGVASARVNLVWEPAWSRDRLSEAAMLQLGLM